ncbi:MAG: glycosyltransferase family 2 protein [Nocardioidaceae bacterium]
MSITAREPVAPGAAHPALPSSAPAYADTCVVIPMYNEASVISDVVTRILELFPNVVCVDDGSVDNSVELAAAAGATVVRHSVNLGQGAALQTGIEFGLAGSADIQYFLTFDADGQHRVEDAVAMVSEARKGEVDVVLGSRFLGSVRHIPRSRRLVLRAAVVFTRMTTGLALTDAHNGLRVLNRSAAACLRLRLTGMAHASEILNVIARSQLTYRELPIEVLYTDYSRQKGQSSINAVNIVFDLMVHRLRFAR